MADAPETPIVASLRRALAANPDDVVLRLHLAQTLLSAGDAAGAIAEASIALQADPGNRQALGLLAAAATALSTPAETMPPAAPSAPAAPAGAQDAQDAPGTSGGFDWEQAEQEVGSAVPPPFVERVPVSPLAEDDGSGAPVEVAREAVTLADVGGLDDVKRRLEESFLAPMRNADVARAFGKSLRGGLLLYGPPGCGKTFLARAVAGELGATFMSVSMTDVIGAYMGETQKNLKRVFDEARAQAPTVLFIDEIDSIGMRRGALSGGGAAWLRQMVNELLLQLDSMSGDNDGLYVLAATNNPWDLDEALLRPGRLDRSILVSPPDAAARASILRHHLKDRPIAGIDVGHLAAATEGFSGADLEHVAVTAAEKAMMQSIAHGSISPITMDHLDAALREIRPSTLAWLASARNVVRFSNADGRYDDLAALLDRKRR
ncbi:AAA family ATPase [Arthrobacter sp. Soc17.1.1.1]|uniref:ATP-binding protein n=1 Tax=Arthrobacter sp. Soc17.1.1.1 TaxID=3121277 RepID=UPI002FE4369B